MRTPKKIAYLVVAGLFLYLSLYTWNLRTGHLDALSSHTGLDIAGWVLRPGQWVGQQVSGFWNRYIYLMGVREDNERLYAELKTVRAENLLLRDRASSADRLSLAMSFTPPDKWAYQGSRVIAHRLGPATGLRTITIAKGSYNGVKSDTPVVCLDGVVGRVLRVGTAQSHVLLLTDPNSRIAVLGKTHRSQGIAVGQGPGKPLEISYVNINAAIEPGEMLVTSGMSGIFPKGLPVAKVTTVRRSDISLFLKIMAEPLVDPDVLEEVLLLTRKPKVAGGANDADD